LSNKIRTTNGVNINVEDIGAGKPIVFIHGWPVNHKMFEYQFTELPKHGYRCIGIDLRGFGDSDKPWDGYNYNSMADDVKAVLDTLNLQNVTLVGFSMGGAIAIHYIARHQGSHISKLVLLGAAAPCFTKREDFHMVLISLLWMVLFNKLIQIVHQCSKTLVKYFLQILKN